MGDKISTIQAWRFIAASAVVFSHSYAKVLRAFPDEHSTVFSVGSLGTWGPWGVDLFFVISGFIMTWTTWDHFEGGTLEFWKRRVARIVPVYWIATSIGVALLLAAPHLYSGGQRFDGSWVAASYAFLPWPAANGDIFNPVLGLGWTLNFEMYFYVLFGCAMLLGRSAGLPFLILFMVLSVAIGTAAQFSAPLLVQSTSWLLLEFVLGIAVAGMVKHRIAVSHGAVGVLALVAACTLFFTVFVNPTELRLVGLHFGRFVLWGIPAAILVYCSLALRVKVPQRLARLGDASYSIYIFHIFALPAIALAMKWLALNLVFHTDVLILAMTATAIAAGVSAYHFIERPLKETFTFRPIRQMSLRRIP